jgi:DNA transformation protein
MIDKGYVDHCLELLAPLGTTRAKRMFSGYGLYIDDLCVALLLREAQLYLKVDDASRAAFEAAGCKPFTYETKTGERTALSYYTAPDEAMESPAEMRPWARRALAAAVAARAAKAPKKKPAAKKAAARKAVATKAPAKKPVATKAPAKPAASTAPATKKAATKVPAPKAAAPAKRARKPPARP